MRFTLIAVLIATAFGGGCRAVQSNSPLVDKEHVVYDPELVGKWVSYQNETRVLEVEAGNEPESYRVRLTGVGEYRAKLGRWDQGEFADVELLSAPEAHNSEDMKKMMPAHLFCRIRHNGDLLWLAYMDVLGVQKYLVNPVETRGSVFVFTGPSEDLQKFVLQNARDDDAFREFRLTRQDSLAAHAERSTQVKFEANYHGIMGTLVFNNGMKDVEFLGYSEEWLGAVPVEFSIPYASVNRIVYDEKTKKHYLTVHYIDTSGSARFVTIHLDKRNYQRALVTTEAQTGIKVERVESK